jgi:hypothetical protein
MSMSISTKLKIKPTVRTVSFDELKNNGAEWMAWWYCGIYKNQKAKSQPKVLVAFKEIISEKIFLKQVPLTALGQITVGSIWKDGSCRSEVVFTTEDFVDLDFSPDGWQLTSFNSAFKNDIDPPYPFSIHPLQYKTDKNWLIEFKLPSGGKLVVPCLEFFSRCYGRSQELNRILATYPWSGAENSCLTKLYAALDESEEPNVWKVKLKTRLRNGDTTLLAHAKYDVYTKEKIKSIYAQIETNFVPESRSPIFINVAPWFQGPAELKAKGIWFDNNRSFLALQVVGCSDPDGILIIRDRENTSKRVGEDTDGIGGEAWAGALEKRLVRPPDIVDLTGDAEPGYDTSSVEVLDQDFAVMGIPRAIVDRHGRKITSRSGARRKGDNASAYSSGEPQGSGKSVGFASIHAKPVMESHGALMDMWNAILHAQRKYPDNIQSVEWFTFEDGYKSMSHPNLIALDPIDDDAAIPTITRNWVYHDVATVRVRGVMVVRLLIKGTPIHIIELQRRPRKIKGENDQEKEGEESFKGFVTKIEDNDQFVRWLKRFLSDVRYIRGIVQKLTPYSSGKADAFTHKSAGYEKVPCEAAVLNALGKVGVVL